MHKVLVKQYYNEYSFWIIIQVWVLTNERAAFRQHVKIHTMKSFFFFWPGKSTKNTEHRDLPTWEALEIQLSEPANA